MTAPPSVPNAPLPIPPWDSVFAVHPLVVVGTLEKDGTPDLAPKHMAMPLGWGPYYGFVCTPSHRTHENARRTGCFTVSYPTPDQVVVASLTASPRCEDGSKPEIGALETEPAHEIDGIVLREARLVLECRLERIIEGFGENTLVTGRIVAARAPQGSVRRGDVDDGDILETHPLLAFVAPNRFARLGASHAFPFPEDMRR